MSEPIDELITYADHTHGCMGAAGHDMCTCGYDDAYAKMWAAWAALKAENARLRKDAARYRWLRDGGDYYLFCITQIAAAIATIWHESTRRETPYRASDREGAAR